MTELKFDDPTYIYDTVCYILNYTDQASDIRNFMVRPKLFCLTASSLLRR